MSELEIIQTQYNEVLQRDLGLKELGEWGGMITSILHTLDIDPNQALEGMKLTNAGLMPGKKIVLYILRKWIVYHGGDPKFIDLVPGTQSTPYHDRHTYTLRIKPLQEVLTDMTSSMVWEKYQEIHGFITSESYATLQKLDNTTIYVD